MTIQPTRSHLSRLMKIWRSAGWPSRDPIDVELVAAGWVSLVGDHPSRECLRLTEAGIEVLAQGRQANRRAESLHDKLALRMADHLMSTGRVVWRELSLRALVAREDAGQRDTDVQQALGATSLWEEPGPGTDIGSGMNSDTDAAIESPQSASAYHRWRMTRPDLYSVRQTNDPAYLQAMVHEVKVSRADLLSDLRHTAKRSSYQWLCSECHYVFPAGLAQPQELPEELGVWVLHGDVETGRLELLRPARHAPCTLPFDVWMALAKASPVRRPIERSQAELNAVDEPDDGID